jgi:hypothetical protein
VFVYLFRWSVVVLLVWLVVICLFVYLFIWLICSWLFLLFLLFACEFLKIS